MRSHKINACSASMEAVTLICAEPTILLISVQFATWLIYYLNFRAPQCDAKASRGDFKKMSFAQRKAWWKHLSDICANLDPRFPLSVFCNANSTMGSVVSQHVSSHGSAPDNVNSPFSPFFTTVACFSQPCSKSSIPAQITTAPLPSASVNVSTMLLSLPPSLCGTSHLMFCLSFCQSSRMTTGLPQYHLMSLCPSALHPFALTALLPVTGRISSDPESIAIFDTLCDDFKYNPSAKLFSMCNDVTSQIRSSCSEAFPFSGPTPRDSWVSPHTWKVINSAKRIRRSRGNLGMRIKPLSLTTVFLSWHSVCHKLHALYGQRPAVAKPNGLVPFYDVVSTHRTWYMVHTISLYALQFSATRNYYIDYRCLQRQDFYQRPQFCFYFQCRHSYTFPM